jgi:hypothetical protein
MTPGLCPEAASGAQSTLPGLQPTAPQAQNPPDDYNRLETRTHFSSLLGFCPSRFRRLGLR